MRRVDEPKIEVVADDKATLFFNQGKILRALLDTIDALNANADEAEETRALAEVCHDKDGELHEWCEKLTERVEALERDTALHFAGHDYADEPNEPIDLDAATFETPKWRPEPITGHWECDNCGKDWGDGGDLIGITEPLRESYRDADLVCLACGNQAATWHPHERPQTVDNPDTPEQTTTGHTVHVPNDLTRQTMDETDRGEDITEHVNVERLMADLDDTQELNPGQRDEWLARGREKELRDEIANLKAELEETKSMVDPNNMQAWKQLKAENERLKNAVNYWYSMRRHKKSDKALSEHAMKLKANLTAAQKRIDKALTLARANLEHYEASSAHVAVAIRDTFLLRDLRRIIAALDSE